MIDYYNLLGLRPSAAPAEIRAAFRRKAKEAHPDAHPKLGAEGKEAMQRRFIQLAHAYETLANPERRAEYDRELRAARARAARPATRRRPRPGAGGAAAGGGPRQTRGGPPPQGGADADLDDLKQEVADLLQKFGLDLRNQFADMLDKMFGWALAVFLDVVTALDGEKARHRSGESSSAADPETAGPEAARRTPPGAGAAEREGAGEQSGQNDRRPDAATAGRGGGGQAQPDGEADFEAELAALKQQVRSAGRRATRAEPTQESVEKELARIKAAMGKGPESG